MIYHLYYALIMAGYSAASILLGSYMMRYAGATELDLGFLFMIQPITIFLRPLICAQADRYQSHRLLMASFALLTALAYVPFIVLPFMGGDALDLVATASQPFEVANELQTNANSNPNSNADSNSNLASQLVGSQAPSSAQLKYWSLVAFHTIGSVGFCGVRSLGDALAVNYAKRIGANFARYRKYGSISYGLCGFCLGLINQDWLLPDFVPSLLMYSVSMFLLAALVYAWPNQYFIMCSRNYDDPLVRQRYIASLPGGRETARHIGRTLAGALLPNCCAANQLEFENGGAKAAALPPDGQPQRWAAETKGFSSITAGGLGKTYGATNASEGAGAGCQQTETGLTPPLRPPQVQLLDDRSRKLTARQQLSIMALLLRRDFRVLLYLLTMFYGGLVGYSGPNFVFTYINVVCHQRGTCNGAELTGLVIISYCCVETICYMLIDRFRGRLNRVLMIELTFVSLAIHYYFYGFALEHLSPYYFLVESLHGIEYSISLSTCVELGYYFAREVELLLPELVRRNIISPSDNQELVKVSLMATMSGCFTLVYDGLGCILGSLAFGLITGRHSFTVTWIVIGSLAVLGFLLILLAVCLGGCFRIRPEILKIRDRASQQSQSQRRAS